MANNEGTPLHGDRSVYNTVDFPDEHARDINDGALEYHLPLPSSANEVVQSDGSNWTASTILTLVNAGLHILDTNASHDLIISPGSDLSADRILTLTTGDAARTITLSGNPTLDDWFDQSVKVSASPTFADVFVPDGGTFGISGNELLTFDAAGTAVFTGCDVGIGAGTPTKQFHINSAGSTTVLIQSFGANKDPQFRIQNDARIWYFMCGGSSASDGFVIYDGTAGADRFLVDIAGDVVIGGLVAAAGQLHVDQASATGAQPVAFLDQGDVSEQLIIGSYSGADVDMIIIELDVTGAPKLGWADTPDRFYLNKGLAIGDGGTTNYANFAGDGELTLFGTARVMRCFHFEPTVTRLPGANPPAEDNIDNFAFHRYDRGTEESVYVHWEIPHNYAAAGTVHLHFEFLVENPPVGDDEAVVMGIEYKKLSEGDVFDFDGGTASGTVTETIVDGETAYITHMTGEINLTTTGWAPMDVILFRFYRDATNPADTYDNEGAPAANDVWVYSYHLEWLSDKLGTAT